MGRSDREPEGAVSELARESMARANRLSRALEVIAYHEEFVGNPEAEELRMIARNALEAL